MASAAVPSCATATLILDDAEQLKPRSLSNGNMFQGQEPTPPHTIKQEDSDRARPRSQSHDLDEDDKRDLKQVTPDDGAQDPENSSHSDGGPARKRRRSRKGLDKKFECSEEGCGKSYSRAEHLYRHQLNHAPKNIFYCGIGDCTRSFVRQDLCNRHKDRHTAKGSSLNRKDRDGFMPQPSSPFATGVSSAFPVPSPTSPADRRRSIPYPNAVPQHVHYGSANPSFGQQTAVSPSTYSPTMRQNPLGYTQSPVTSTQAQPHSLPLHSSPGVHPRRPNVPPDGSPYGVLSPVSTHNGFYSHQNTPQTQIFTAQNNFPPLDLSPISMSQATSPVIPPDLGQSTPFATTAFQAEYSDQVGQQRGSDLMMLDQMTMPQTMPVFGSDNIYHKSPYAGMPEDFMAYLFNTGGSQPSDSPQGRIAPTPRFSHYGEFHNQYSIPYEPSQLGFFPQQVMSVTNLLDQNLPESVISEEKSSEIFEYIKERFHGIESAPVERQKENIVEGDRSQPSHMLSRQMMQAYIMSYWLHVSDQVPILHKPTFQPDKAQNLLLIAVMMIGAACLDKEHGPKIRTAGAQLSNFLAWDLRWALFRDSQNFGPPAKLWVFQSLLLLEMYEKMYSTRQLHERAHIHHATTITLMRRGRSLLGKSALDSPPTAQHGSRQSSTSGVAHTPDEWWNHWITNESTRRAAFAAFLIDSIHGTIFGHNVVMVAHEMRLPLPCDDNLWKATSGAEVGRLEANLQSNNIKPISFLEGLRRTLGNQPVQTNAFGRTVLIAGLLNVSYHMNQRDLQVYSLGRPALQSLGGREKWRQALRQAFDVWRDEFDKAIKRGDIPSEVYLYGQDKHSEANVIFEGRTVLHSLAHMAMHVDIVDCQIYARAKRLLGRPIGTQDLNSSKRRMKDTWAPSAHARDAVYYALQFLSSVLMPRKLTSPSMQPPVGRQTPEEPYSPQADVLMHRPWVLYIAGLIVWCYGFAIEGPCVDYIVAPTKEGRITQMQEYLHKYASVDTPEMLSKKRGMNENTALLMVLRDSFEMTRWELLHEGATLLNNCVQLNTGVLV